MIFASRYAIDPCWPCSCGPCTDSNTIVIRAAYRTVRLFRRPRYRVPESSRWLDDHVVEMRKAWLKRQHEAAWKLTEPRRPVLPTLAAAPSWGQQVRAWLRQLPRLKKGSRQS